MPALSLCVVWSYYRAPTERCLWPYCESIWLWFCMKIFGMLHHMPYFGAILILLKGENIPDIQHPIEHHSAALLCSWGLTSGYSGKNVFHYHLNLGKKYKLIWAFWQDYLVWHLLWIVSTKNNYIGRLQNVTNLFKISDP